MPEGRHTLLQATPDKGRKKWLLILCAWTIVALLFAAQQIVVEKVQGSQVHWVIRLRSNFSGGCMGGVHAACDRSHETVPVDGAEAYTSYSDPRNHVAHDGSPCISHPTLSEAVDFCD